MSNVNKTRFHTMILTNASIVLTGDEGVQEISMVSIDTAQISILGDFPFQNSGINTAIPIPSGMPLTLSSSANYPLAGLTITAVGGSVILIIKF